MGSRCPFLSVSLNHGRWEAIAVEIPRRRRRRSEVSRRFFGDDAAYFLTVD